MSLESFIGMEEGGEGMSAAALEQLREKMRAAQAQIAAIKREEKKHKKKEVELVRILLKFVQTSHKKDLVLLISRALEQNLPANFILALVLLGNEEIQKEVGKFLMLKESRDDGEEAEKLSGGVSADEKSLVFFREDESLPLKIKIELDNWVKNILFQAEETPQKLLKTAFDVTYFEEEDEYGDIKKQQQKSIKQVIINLATFVLEDYLENKKVQVPHENLQNFCHFIIKGILEKTQESLDKRAFLEGDRAEDL